MDKNNLTLRTDEERKASAGKFRAMLLIDSEFYQLGEDQDTFQDAHNLLKEHTKGELCAVYDDQGRARSPQDDQTGIHRVWTEDEIKTMSEQAFGELRGFQKHLGRTGATITAHQLGLTLQLAQKEFERVKNGSPALFAVTTIVSGWPSEESKRYGGKRTPIICTTLEIAKDVVLRNVGDIFETTYRYAVIATVFPDVLYSFPGQEEYKEYWYNWEGDYETGKYVPCEKPEEYKNTVGWGIG